jgi:hypothetical protein
MKYFRIEDRYINPAFERRDQFVDQRYADFNHGLQLREEGRLAEAFDLMHKAVRRDPLNDSAADNLWELGVLLKRQDEAKIPYLQVVESEIKHRYFERALVHFRELKERFPDLTLSLPAKVSLLSYFTKHRQLEDARTIARQIRGELTPASSAELIQDYIKALLVISPDEARGEGQRISSHPGLSPEQKADLMSMLEKGGSEGEGVGKSVSGETSGNSRQSDSPGSPALRTIGAVPLALKDGFLAISRDGKAKALPYERIQMISLVRIRPPDQGSPYLLIDLFLDFPQRGKTAAVVRLTSRNMDPRRIIPEAASTKEAFVTFFTRLVGQCNARSWPLRESQLLRSLRVYPGVAIYENQLLKSLTGS